MFKATISYSGIKFKEVIAEKVTEKTVTINGRRRAKISGHGGYQTRFYETQEEALDWLQECATADKKKAEEQYDQAEEDLLTIASWRS